MMSNNEKQDVEAITRKRPLSLNLVRVGWILILCYVFQFTALLWHSNDLHPTSELKKSPRDLKPKSTTNKDINAKRHLKRNAKIKNPEDAAISKQTVLKQSAPHYSATSKPATKVSTKNKSSKPNQDKNAISSQHNQKSQYKPWDSSTWPWEFLPDTPSTKPYLVVCHKMEDWFYPISDYFTIKRIIDGELPPWNATVLLLHEDTWCQNHSYVVEAVRRREEAKVHLNVDADTQSSHMHHGWKDGVYWPGIKSNFFKSIKNRPALVRIRGEVFWRNKDSSCSDVDFIVDRQTERLFEDCLTIHFIQGVSSAYLREHAENKEDKGLGVKETADFYQQKVVHPKADPNLPFPYSNFCSFLVRFDPNKLVEMFNSTSYDIDAVVRHLFFRQLSEYKPCTRVMDCKGNPYNSYKCMAMGYKFHITMENSLVDGYVSEKIFNGALGSGIPIYFGATDVGSFLNTKSFVHCNISRSVIEEMRTFYPRAPKPRPFLFNRTSVGFFPTEDELFQWADGYLRPHLKPCVDRVIELDTNDDAFRQVVSEPFVTNPDILNGQYPFRGIEYALRTLKNLTQQ